MFNPTRPISRATRTTISLTAIATAMMAAPLAAQDASGGDQTLAQEAAASQGVALFISPADIRQIQQALNQNGYDAGNVDGTWNDQTISALCNFQQAQGLEPTGNFNPQTVSAMGLGDILTGQAAGQDVGAGDQQLAQEASIASGAPLFVSPSTVRQIEQALNEAGYDAGNIDGVWDDSLGTALANFEQAQGMEPTGTVTLEAISAMNISFGGQGGQGADQQLAQETSEISPEDCVAAGQASAQMAQAGMGGGQQAGGGAAEEATTDVADAQTGTAGATEGQQDSPESGQQVAQAQGGDMSGTQLFLSTATVRQVEQALNAAGYDAGSVDGLWDDGLATALANFQQAQALEPTGNLNTRAISALQVDANLQVLSGGGGQGGQQPSQGGEQQAQEQQQTQDGQQQAEGEVEQSADVENVEQTAGETEGGTVTIVTPEGETTTEELE